MAAAATSGQEDIVVTTTRPQIALTTVYTPPATCNSYVTYDGTTLWQNGVSQTGDINCYPPEFPLILGSYYSPGICPHQWTSAGSLSHSSGFDAMCCPSSYFLSTTDATSLLANFCFSLMTTPLSNVVSVQSIGDVPAQNPSLTTLSASDVSSTTVYADVIQVQWQSTDKNIINLLKQSTAASMTGPTGSRTASPASTRTAGASSTRSATASPSASASSNSSGGLSTGAKAGIGIGVALAVLALAALAAFLFLLRRRRRRTREANPQGLSDYKTAAYHEMDQTEAQRPAHTVPAPPPQELEAVDAASSVGELDGSEIRAELDDNNHHQTREEREDDKESFLGGNNNNHKSPENNGESYLSPGGGRGGGGGAATSRGGSSQKRYSSRKRDSSDSDGTGPI